MATGQSGHITQFYETTLTAFIFVLTGIEILSFVFKIHSHNSQQSMKAYNEELQWQRNRMKTNQSQQNQVQPQNQLQKQVTNYVQNEITNMQKNQQEDKQTKQQQDDSPANEQLPPNKQRIYWIYQSFKQFMNEKMALLMPLLVIGILTQSTYVYSLAACFFAILCQVLILVLEKQRKIRGMLFIGSTLTVWLKIIEILFVISIFVSYWIVDQYSAS